MTISDYAIIATLALLGLLALAAIIELARVIVIARRRRRLGRTFSFWRYRRQRWLVRRRRWRLWRRSRRPLIGVRPPDYKSGWWEIWKRPTPPELEFEVMGWRPAFPSRRRRWPRRLAGRYLDERPPRAGWFDFWKWWKGAAPGPIYTVPPRPNYRSAWWQLWRPKMPQYLRDLLPPPPSTAEEYQREARAAPIMVRCFGWTREYTAIWHPRVVRERYYAQKRYLNEATWTMPTFLWGGCAFAQLFIFAGMYFYLSTLETGPIQRTNPFIEAAAMTGFSGSVVFMIAFSYRITAMWNAAWAPAIIYFYSMLPGGRWIISEVNLRILRLAFCDVGGERDFFSAGGMKDGVIYLEAEMADEMGMNWLIEDPRRIYLLDPARKSWRGSGASRAYDGIIRKVGLGARYDARNQDRNWEMLKENWPYIGSIIIWGMIMLWVMNNQPLPGEYDTRPAASEAAATPESAPPPVPTAERISRGAPR